MPKSSVLSLVLQFGSFYDIFYPYQVKAGPLVPSGERPWSWGYTEWCATEGIFGESNWSAEDKASPFLSLLLHLTCSILKLNRRICCFPGMYSTIWLITQMTTVAHYLGSQVQLHSTKSKHEDYVLRPRLLKAHSVSRAYYWLAVLSPLLAGNIFTCFAEVSNWTDLCSNLGFMIFKTHLPTQAGPFLHLEHRHHKRSQYFQCIRSILMILHRLVHVSLPMVPQRGYYYFQFTAEDIEGSLDLSDLLLEVCSLILCLFLYSHPTIFVL